MTRRTLEEIETCCVVDQFCKSPANLSPPVHLRSRCFCCGQAVCENCSSRRQFYSNGRVRLCNNCQEEYDGDDRRVMARLHKLAEGKA